MNCETFERWLDDGCPEAAGSSARAHASACARCAAALGSAREIDATLARYRALAPGEFTDQVMKRVAAVEAARVAVPPIVPPLDWWVRIAFQPAAVLALTLAGLVAWRADVLLRVGAPLGLRLAEAASRIELPSFALFERPGMPLALGLAAAPFLLWASWRLYVVIERSGIAGAVRAR